jgi:hypothetical protein
MDILYIIYHMGIPYSLQKYSKECMLPICALLEKYDSNLTDRSREIWFQPNRQIDKQQSYSSIPSYFADCIVGIPISIL